MYKTKLHILVDKEICNKYFCYLNSKEQEIMSRSFWPLLIKQLCKTLAGNSLRNTTHWKAWG